MPPSKSKRRRNRRVLGDDDPSEKAGDHTYTVGSLVRMRMTDFVTYEDVEFSPGPRLNVIIGPNGSGKSSIVCGLALGLGGGPEIIGRAKEVGQFVRHGADVGTIEIELYGEPSNHTFVREIRKDNSSKWWLNGSSSTKREVLGVARKLNVQVDNLCQFLPQDKVAQFAGMNEYALLRETEKAIGGQAMIDQHEKLIERGKELQVLSRTAGEHQTILDEMKRKNETLKVEVEQYRRRQSLLEEIKLLKLKKPWLVFEKKRKEALSLKAEKQQAKADCQACEDRNRPLANEINQLKKRARDGRKKKDELESKILRLNRTRNKAMMDAENLTQAEEGYLNAIEENKKEKVSAEKKIRALELHIQNLEEEYDALPDPAEHAERVSNIKEEKKSLAAERYEAQQRATELDSDKRRLESRINDLGRQLQDLENVKNQRLRTLRNRLPEVYNAWEWLRNNKHEFRDEVYGPVCLELDCSNPYHGICIETVIGRAGGSAFVTGNAHDRNKLVQAFRRQNFRSTVVNFEGAYDPRSFPNPVGVDFIRDHEAEGFLDAMFDAPPRVKGYLCDTFKMHAHLVGSARTERNIAALLDDRRGKGRLGNVFTPSTVYSVRVSKYGDRAVSTSSSPLSKRASGLIMGGIDDEAKEDITRRIHQARIDRDELENQSRSFHAQLKNTDERIAQLKHEEKELSKSQRAQGTLLRRIRVQKNKMSTLQETLDSDIYAKREEESLRKLEETQVERVSYMRQSVDAMVAHASALAEQEGTILRLLQAEVLLRIKTQEQAESLQQLRSLKERLTHAERAFKKARSEATELRDRAEERAPFEEYQERFAELPNSLVELDDKIGELRARAETHASINSRVLEEYEQRQEQIASLEEAVASHSSKVNEATEAINEQKASWVSSLKEMVEKISGSFSKYFTEIGCDGSVALLEDAEDYAKYGIQLMVKFREEEDVQRTLSKTMQSGGERSVATMLYLISLQDLTSCPFRLVDEINQGMDPRNERMVFQQVVDCACRPGLAQYFLVTPKLLPDLHFRPEVTVLCVMNGPFQVPQKDWKMNAFLRRAAFMASQ